MTAVKSMEWRYDQLLSFLNRFSLHLLAATCSLNKDGDGEGELIGLKIGELVSVSTSGFCGVISFANNNGKVLLLTWSRVHT